MGLGTCLDAPSPVSHLYVAPGASTLATGIGHVLLQTGLRVGVGWLGQKAASAGGQLLACGWAPQGWSIGRVCVRLQTGGSPYWVWSRIRIRGAVCHCGMLRGVRRSLLPFGWHWLGGDSCHPPRTGSVCQPRGGTQIQTWRKCRWLSSLGSFRHCWIPGLAAPEQVKAEVPVVLAGMQPQGWRAGTWP